MLQSIASWFKIDTASAHCDIPCGVYDPSAAAYQARAVLALTKKIIELTIPKDNATDEEMRALHCTTSRMVQAKETAAQQCKQELLILWTDYFKPQHLQLFPDLHDTFWNAAKLCSFTKQNVDSEKAEELQETVAKVAGMFAEAEAQKSKPMASVGKR